MLREREVCKGMLSAGGGDPRINIVGPTWFRRFSYSCVTILTFVTIYVLFQSYSNSSNVISVSNSFKL